MDHFVSQLIKGKKYPHEVNKAIFVMSRMTKGTRQHMRAFRDDHPAQYGAYRRLGMRESIAQNFEIDDCREDGSFYSLEYRLMDQGLLTAEPGRDWYAAHFEGMALVDVLTKVSLIKGCDRDWLAAAFASWPHPLLEALKRANLFTQECGCDWYAKHLSKIGGIAFQKLLRDLGFMTRDTPLEWFELQFPPLEKYECDYLGKSDLGYLLYRALKTSGYLTAELGFDWYAARFDGEVLLDAMIVGGAIDYFSICPGTGGQNK